MTECLKYKTGSTGKEKDYITREGVFRHMWMNTELTEDHKKYIYEKYPNIWEPVSYTHLDRIMHDAYKINIVPTVYITRE